VVGAMAVLLAAPVSRAGQMPTAPEARLLELINEARDDVGRVALQWDKRLADIAQWRSSDMVASNYFGHIEWSAITKRLADKKVAWYLLGETLVKGTPLPALESAQQAVTTWRNSEPHWNLLSSPDYNYVALGVATDANGWYYWTALLLRGPDRTAPTASTTGAHVTGATRTTRHVTVSWTGADVQLSALTAGVRDFRVQRRTGSGAWADVAIWTTATSKGFSLDPSRTYGFRVRSRDANGNKSAWSPTLTVAP